MKIRLAATIGVLAAFFFTSFARAQDLRAKIEAFYSQSDSVTNDKDLDGCVSLLTEDYRILLSGMDREGARNTTKSVMSSYEEIQMQSTPLEISQYGEFIKVLVHSKVRVKTKDGDWADLVEIHSFDYLRYEGGSLKAARSVEIDKTRLDFIKGQTYGDADAPLAFTAPNGWGIIPVAYPSPAMKGAVLVLPPDLNSMAFAAYLKAPGISAKQAVESDEAVTKALSKDSVYELYKSGTVDIGSYEGFETESKFILPNNVDIRHRHRVYFKAHGNLYVLFFDAIPFTRLNEVKEGFQSILTSVKVDD